MSKFALDADRAASLMTRARPVLARRSALDLVARLPLAKAAGRPDSKAWYRIDRANADSDEADLYLFDEIGFWGTTASDFVRDLNELDVSTINLHVNSPGGSVFDGFAIYASLAQHEARIVADVVGWAASIASVIICAADHIKIGEQAQVMIHCPWSFVVGDADDMRSEADILDELESAILDIYVARTGGKRADLKSQMKAETWFRGDAAKDAGFADEVIKLKEKAKPAARLPAEFFASIFPHLPADVRAEIPVPCAPATAITTPREFQNFLREYGGFTGARARAITSNGFRPSNAEPPDGAAPASTPTPDRRDDAGRASAAADLIYRAAATYPRT